MTFLDDNEVQSLSMRITSQKNGRMSLDEFSDNFTAHGEQSHTVAAMLGDTISTPVGRLVVRPTLYMNPSWTDTPIRMTKRSLSAATSAYRNAVTCAKANKQTSVVTVSMNDIVPKRVEDVINTLVSVYEDSAVTDKRRISVKTAGFIKACLEVIGSGLDDVDRDIEELKKSNRMFDIPSNAALNISESSRYKAEGLSIENQISIVEFVRAYLTDPANTGDLIPMMAAIDDMSISDQIDEYNTAVLKRGKLFENSSERNPVI